MADDPTPEADVPAPAADNAQKPVDSAKAVAPPVPEANSYGGGIDAADLPPTLPDDAAGPGSAHDD